jgi:hypothetical protein
LRLEKVVADTLDSWEKRIGSSFDDGREILEDEFPWKIREFLVESGDVVSHAAAYIYKESRGWGRDLSFSSTG